MKIIILLLFPCIAFSQKNKYADSIRIIDSVLNIYKPAADTFNMYQRMKYFYIQKAYPNPLQQSQDKQIDSARAMFRKKIKK